MGETKYILEKLAVLVVDVAKREWLLSWMDFDDILLSMWSRNRSTRTIALKVLTDLIEDVFLNDDPVAGLRSPLLSAGLITIMTSTRVIKDFYESHPHSLVHGVEMKPDSPGWLQRFSDELTNDANEQVLPILEVLRATLSWIITEAIVDAKIMNRICGALMDSNVQVRICAVDCLYIILTRPLQPQDKFLTEIYTLYEPASLAALTQVWQMTSDSLSFTRGTLNNDNAYTMLKKLSETIIALACFKFGSTQTMKMEEIDLANILDLVLLTWQHNSLIISGMSNNFWCSVLRDERLNDHPHVTERLVQMLQIGAQRLIQFEDARIQMLKGSEVQMYLDLDLESTPELHAFCSNYRRFAFDIVRMVVFKRPKDATLWIREQFATFFQREYSEGSGSNFGTKTSPMYVSAEMKLALVEACLRGVLRFKELYNAVAASQEASDPVTKLGGVSTDVVSKACWSRERQAEMLQELQQTEEIIFSWCEEIIALPIRDPLILGRHISVLVAFSGFLHSRSGLLFKILEKVIESATYYYPVDVADSNMTSIRDLRGRCGVELLRLGSTLPDQLWEIYPQLEATVGNILGKPTATESEHTVFNALLLAVSQRTKITNEQQKSNEFGKVLVKVVQVWDTPEIAAAFSSFESFAKILMIDQLAEYLSRRQITTASQLDSNQLDPDGHELLQLVKKARNWSWPIRASRKFVDATLDTPKPLHDFEQGLWKEPTARIVPNIFRLLMRISGYYNQTNWQNLPSEVRLIAKESILERFWLHGISQVTRDEFLEASAKRSDTCRELVHTVGHFLRRTREYCLITLGTFSLLGESFYSIPSVGEGIMQSLFGDVQGISLHVWSVSITSCLRHVILNCPQKYYSAVLSNIMVSFPHIILEKLRTEWGKLMERGVLQTKEEEGEDQEGKEDLSDEMMEESLLRYLSYAVVKLMSDILTPPLTSMRIERTAPGMGKNQMSDWLLRQENMVAGIMLLLSFCLTVNDTRTSINAAKILRAITPFLMEVEELQRYVCHEVFSATIRCIHDSYFVSIQADLVNLLAHIYYLSLGKSTLPREILLSIPQMSSDVGVIKQFEDKLAASKSDRSRRSLMHELLVMHEIVGKEGYGRSTTTKVSLGADVTTKEVIKRFQASVTLRQEQERSQNVLAKEEDSGIANLFG